MFVRNNDSSVELLYQAILALEDAKQCHEFFEDLCTIPEIKEMAARIDVAKRLSEGQKYTKITEETGASTATISRVNKCLQYGAGGYKKILEKLK